MSLDKRGFQTTGEGKDKLVSIENVKSGAGNDILSGNQKDNMLTAAPAMIGCLAMRERIFCTAAAAMTGLSAAGVRIPPLFAGNKARSTVDLSISKAQNTGQGRDQLRSIENVETSGGKDHLVGSNAANILKSGSGNDVLSGSGGKDRLYGAKAMTV